MSQHALFSLLPRWVAEGAEPLPPERPGEVAKVFEHLGSIATPDVVSLYSTLGGMRTMDEEYWRLWTLEEIAAQSFSEFGVLFSDYLISCWEYRLRPVSETHSSVFVDRFDGSPPALVAATLEEFFQRYATSAQDLLNQ
ncbi:hypothetical protein [Roseateles paludis]|jgi:hypothetical protein|uniref:SMI1/KNR4 family protein n=1 Tax=Roseateles paludis TaxID=3145238 RepID=A0ABV0G5P9_9BURK